MSPLALTGTPGTGKTTLARLLDRPRLELCDYYEASSDGRDAGGEWQIDLKRMAAAVARDTSPAAVIEGHLSHRLGLCETVVVLRCHPDQLRERLGARGYVEAKLRENLEAEALGIITAEALETGTEIHELDTTGQTPAASAVALAAVLSGAKSYPPGRIDFSEAILGWY
uniref:Putative nucleotide kinase n=1 Tax=uncultured marine group II/III euryarchaeote KM3_194_G04 TaxID=1457969 RepID=A0A075GSD4_9EURY|nr:putative nucleotide kinase [uncultured marine group II/III euryarchaeote KM3_194_G04]